MINGNESLKTDLNTTTNRTKNFPKRNPPQKMKKALVLVEKAAPNTHNFVAEEKDLCCNNFSDQFIW